MYEHTVRIHTWTPVRRYSEAALKAALARYGPVVVAVFSNLNFMSYRSAQPFHFSVFHLFLLCLFFLFFLLQSTDFVVPIPDSLRHYLLTLFFFFFGREGGKEGGSITGDHLRFVSSFNEISRILLPFLMILKHLKTPFKQSLTS